MKAITVRNIPEELAAVLERQARESHTSLNKTVIRLLEKATGLEPRAGHRRHHDLDALAGSWTPEEAADFDRVLEDQRRIDPELWR
ncbi:MAG: hypothetical protein KDD11_19765 [Acidobacteria bacterium]|nr:hypothetical protein [Acidobacteriota bacterium]